MSNENVETKRWLIAGAAIVMQLCLGTVYAWSVFKQGLMANHGWSETATQATFMISIASLGFAAAFGGQLVDRKGPRFVATLGGVLFGVGTMLTGLGDQLGKLWLIYLGYGLIAGVGNGFGYVTPIATLVRWFPDRRGLVTGLAVMGFGAGAFVMGKIAPAQVLSMGVAQTFYIWGAIFLVLVVASAQLYSNPPTGWKPAGFVPKTGAVATSDSASFTYGDALKTPQWWMLWGMLFLNVSAGIGLISQMSPIGQDLFKPLADSSLSGDALTAVIVGAGGTVVAYASICNGLGRLLWAWISDTIGRRTVFVTMFISQALLYLLVAAGVISDYHTFILVACYLLACYGGGFATMPAFAADAFGPKHIGKIYGSMLTAWGVAGVVGPLVFAQVKQATNSFEIALYIAATMLVVGLVLALTYQKPQLQQETELAMEPAE